MFSFFKKSSSFNFGELSRLVDLGNDLFLQKKYKKALKLYHQAYKLNNQYNVAIINLANTYFELKDYSKAKKYALKIQTKETLNILGLIYLDENDYKKSVLAFEKYIKLDSTSAWVWNYLSQAYQKNGDAQKALKAGYNAIVLEDEEEAHHLSYSYTIYEIALEKGEDFVMPFLQKWASEYADNYIAIHALNSFKSGSELSKAGNQYLVKMFDVFACDFDNVLSGLEYKVPVYIKNIFQKQKIKNAKVLDLGCGTGLCAANIKKVCSGIVFDGVDISSEMLEVAKSKEVYRNLYCQEIEDYLLNCDNKYNAAVAGDVFTYFGNLDSVFKKVYSALESNSKFIFSVTDNQLNDKDFFLHISGRFLHSKNYVLACVKEAGFSLDSLDYYHLRNEGDSKVMGYIFVVNKA